MLTTAEAAALLGIKPGSVRALIKRGLLEATKHGRDHLITQEAIERYQASRRQPGHPQAPRE